MRKLAPIAEIIFFVSLFGYLYLVAIKEAVGTPFTPVHDGILLVLAVLIGAIWFVLPNSFTQKTHSKALEPTLIALIGLQVIIVLQAGSQNLQGIEFILTILGVMMFAAASVFFIRAEDGEKLIQKLPPKFEEKIPTDSFPIIAKAFVMLGLGLITIFPWAFWTLSQIGLPVHPMSALVGAALMLVTLGLVKHYTPKQSSSKNSPSQSLGDFIPNPAKLGIHYLSLITVFAILTGVAYYAYAFQKPSEEVLTQGATLSLTDTSTGWTVLDGTVYSTEAAFFPNQFLRFTIEVQETGMYRPTFLAEVSDLGGQIRFEVEELGRGGIIENGELLPFQCSFWIDEEIFEVFLKDNGCPEFPREIELTPVKLEAGSAYQLTIEVTDQFPTAFNEQFQVEFGGYIQLQDFEMRKQ
jgi:hypothetical protein